MLRFKPSGGTQCTVGKLTSIGRVEATSEEIDVTTLDSADGCREKLQGVKDSGSIELNGYFVATNAGQAALCAAYETGAAGAVEIEFTDGTVISFSAFVKQYSIGAAEIGGAVGFGAVLRVTGAITVD